MMRTPPARADAPVFLGAVLGRASARDRVRALRLLLASLWCTITA